MSQIDNPKLFHKGCYIDAVRQMGALIGVCAVAIFFAEYWAICTFVPEADYADINMRYVLLPLSLIYMIISPVLVMYLFRHQFTRAGSDCYHSLPIRRNSLFISYSVAILTVSSFLVLFGVLCAELMVELIYESGRADNSMVLLTFGWYIAATVYTMSAMLLSLSISGSRTMVLCLYMLLFMILLQLKSLWNDISIIGILQTLFLDGVFIVIAYVLNGKRPSETAGHVVIEKFAYVITVPLIICAIIVCIMAAKG